MWILQWLGEEEHPSQCRWPGQIEPNRPTTEEGFGSGRSQRLGGGGEVDWHNPKKCFHAKILKTINLMPLPTSKLGLNRKKAKMQNVWNPQIMVLRMFLKWNMRKKAKSLKGQMAWAQDKGGWDLRWAADRPRSRRGPRGGAPKEKWKKKNVPSAQPHINISLVPHRCVCSYQGSLSRPSPSSCPCYAFPLYPTELWHAAPAEDETPWYRDCSDSSSWGGGWRGENTSYWGMDFENSK